MAAKVKRKRGRPPILELNEQVIGDFRGLGKLAATEREMAGYFTAKYGTRISQQAINWFLGRHEKARSAYDSGLAGECLSLRRKQMEVAEAGDKTLLIWLGKQLLGQRDKHEQKLDVSLSWVSDASKQVDALLSRALADAKRD